MVCLVIDFENNFCFLEKKWENMFGNQKIVLTKNNNNNVFREYILVVFNWFHLFSKDYFKK